MVRGPFAIFRKYQKVLLVVFGVLIIFVFTLGSAPIAMSFLGLGSSVQGTAETPVLTWNGGQIYERDLAMMRFQHDGVIEFLRAAITEAMKKGVQPALGIQIDQSTGAILHPGLPANNSDQALVRTKLLAEKAIQMGMEVSDTTIYAFLDYVTSNGLSNSQFANILNSLSRGRINEHSLFEALRVELLAQNLLKLATAGITADTPGASWDYFNRLHRIVSVEFMPLPVAEFVDSDADPAESELHEFYEQYKDQFPNVLSPEPGFKRRRKISIQYMEGEFDKFLQQEIAKVTDQQVQNYYDENKDLFLTPELPEADPNDPRQAVPNPPVPPGAADPPTDPRAAVPNPPVPPVVSDTSDTSDNAAPARYKPLEEVTDQIRRTTALPIAQQAFNEKMTTAKARMTRYFKAYTKHKALSEAGGEESDSSPPVPLDFAQVAQEFGFFEVSTPLVDALELRENYPIGTSDFRDATGFLPFARVAFEPNLLNYAPKETSRFDLGKRYLFWKTDYQEAFVPPLDEIRDEVVSAWRMRAALTDATVEAERIAEKLSKNRQSLKQGQDLFSDREVIVAEEFTWLTGGDFRSSQPYLSSVAGVEHPGEDFMRAVFALPVGKTGVAINRPHTFVYVVHVASETLDTEMRRKEFFQSGLTPQLQVVAYRVRQQLFSDWIEELEQQMGLQWLKKPELAGRAG